jgi:hypothetical protein
MAILREKQTWRRAPSGRKRKSRNQVFALTPEQHANVKAAMRALRMTQAQIAGAAGCSVTAIEKATVCSRRVLPGPPFAQLADHGARKCPAHRRRTPNAARAATGRDSVASATTG